VAEATAPKLELDPAEIDNPVLAFFLQYWRMKRGGRIMPARADIEPREMKAYIGWVCLLDALPGYTDFRYRLVGSRVSEYFLGDGTGHTVSEALAGANKRILEGALWLFRKTCNDHAPIRVWSPGGEWKGRYYPDNDALYLPLSSDGKNADMVMNVFTFNYEEYKKTHSVRTMTHTG
jgi:hypothetical protein